MFPYVPVEGNVLSKAWLESELNFVRNIDTPLKMYVLYCRVSIVRKCWQNLKTGGMKRVISEEGNKD
jgi:hypothetical protein